MAREWSEAGACASRTQAVSVLASGITYFCTDYYNGTAVAEQRFLNVLETFADKWNIPFSADEVREEAARRQNTGTNSEDDYYNIWDDSGC